MLLRGPSARGGGRALLTPDDNSSPSGPASSSPGPAPLRDQNQSIWPDQLSRLGVFPDSQTRYYNISSWITAIDASDNPRPYSSLTPDSGPIGSTGRTPQSQSAASPGKQLDSFAQRSEIDRLTLWYLQLCQFVVPHSGRQWSRQDYAESPLSRELSRRV